MRMIGTGDVKADLAFGWPADRVIPRLLSSFSYQRERVFWSRHVLGGIGAVLLLCAVSASAQEASPTPRAILDQHAMAVSRAGWSANSESNGLGELAFVDALRRHAKVDQYKETPTAGLKLYHYTAGLEFELPVMQHSRWDLVADFGLGATRLRSATFTGHYASEQRVSETFLSLLGGLSVQYAVSDDCRLFVGARRLLYLEDSSGLVIDGLNDPNQVLESGSWTFPLTFGMRIGFR